MLSIPIWVVLRIGSERDFSAMYIFARYLPIDSRYFILVQKKNVEARDIVTVPSTTCTKIYIFEFILLSDTKVAVKTWKYDLDDTRTMESILDELKIMISVETSREQYQDRSFSQFVIQLIGCGLTPSESIQNGVGIALEQWPFLVLEYAEVKSDLYIVVK